jgi:hypothetical protein
MAAEETPMSMHYRLESLVLCLISAREQVSVHPDVGYVSR